MENQFRWVRGLLSAQDRSQTAQIFYFSRNPFRSLTSAPELSFFGHALFRKGTSPCRNGTVTATSNGNPTRFYTRHDEETIHRDRKTLFRNPQLSA